jgi:hypothetical protein
MVAAIRDAIAVANRYHPDEVILLTKAVSLRQLQKPFKLKKRRVEDLLISHGFSVKPVVRGRSKIWHVGHGNLDDPSNEAVGKSTNLKLAIEEAAAREVKKQLEKSND